MAKQVRVVSVSRVVPTNKCPGPCPSPTQLRLSVSDLPMLSCHYIQKGCLYLYGDHHSESQESLVPRLTAALSHALSRFPPLAGSLSADRLSLLCDHSGADFILAHAPALSLRHILSPPHVPTHLLRPLFPLHHTLSYAGHSRPLLSVQLTLLSDALFLSCAVNHSVADGTSFWHFFNTFADLSRHGLAPLSRPAPDFSRHSVLMSDTAILQLPEGGPQVSFSTDSPLTERIFSFSREAVLSLKDAANNANQSDIEIEILGKQLHDKYHNSNNKQPELSSFQSLCALLWRGVTRARKLPPSKSTTFRMAVNCRHRLCPKLDPFYFGNAIQSVPTRAPAGELLANDLRWCAEQLSQSVRAHDDGAVRRMVAEWERSPRCFPLGNPDGASITMGSSPRFPMYDNDFGWGRPIAVRSGPANKFDGKISAFPGRDGAGSVDLEVVLSSQTMTALESDAEFMRYVSTRTGSYNF